MATSPDISVRVIVPDGHELGRRMARAMDRLTDILPPLDADQWLGVVNVLAELATGRKNCVTAGRNPHTVTHYAIPDTGGYAWCNDGRGKTSEDPREVDCGDCCQGDEFKAHLRAVKYG